MGQAWKDCNEDVKDFVDNVVEEFKKELSTNLKSIILHGSLAMGSFYPPKSDIDLLIIVKSPLDLSVQKSIHKKMIELVKTRPIIGFLEFSIVLENIALEPVHPIDYELHFGEEFPEKIESGNFDYGKSKGFDVDLAAHFTVAKNRGIALFGSKPQDVLGTVSWQDYLDAVIDDLNWITDNLHILESPFYGVLNSCRVLQMLEEGEGTVSSKEEGALWALKNLDKEHQAIIELALTCYRSDKVITPEQRQKGGIDWPEASLIAFRDYIAGRVKTAR